MKDTSKQIYRFDPRIVVTDARGKPIHSGEEIQGKLRQELLALQTEFARCSHKDASQDDAATVPAKNEAITQFLIEHSPRLTLGYAVVEVMSKPLLTKPGDPRSIEALTGTKMATYMKFAIDVLRAIDAGEYVDMDEDEWKTVKERIPRNYPHPAVLSRLEEAVEKLPIRPAVVAA